MRTYYPTVKDAKKCIQRIKNEISALEAQKKKLEKLKSEWEESLKEAQQREKDGLPTGVTVNDTTDEESG